MIEITPEMTAAGEAALLFELGGAVSVNSSPDELANAVYRAMDACRPSSSRQHPYPAKTLPMTIDAQQHVRYRLT
jgi:hypothetical protein